MGHSNEEGIGGMSSRGHGCSESKEEVGELMHWGFAGPCCAQELRR